MYWCKKMEHVALVERCFQMERYLNSSISKRYMLIFYCLWVCITLAGLWLPWQSSATSRKQRHFEGEPSWQAQSHRVWWPCMATAPKPWLTH